MSLTPSIFRISPLIRITLVSLYLALTIPLPFLAQVTQTSISTSIFWGAIILGFLVLWGALSEKVIVDEDNIKVTYPQWFPSFFRQRWELSWTEIKDLKLRTTGQGGLVYYFISDKTEQAYLLPMRVAGFARLVNIVTEKTGIDTTDIRPLSQPWMYFILLGLTLLLLFVDSWTILTALNQ
ncbi:hypothetical protein [Aphanothece sacrum]|uniref:Uncharacterized protein n=1 Tax=Aphanothece sacrum FPU1 TaxID=1920663 RepID=A0A401IC66_APHSA|nr:hypothetical protein [Aphanothece sacrum]GBF78845.1 hypothetical protein AsFPU1_0235 [Aphanothece sacrum FPU1]GBF83077.1 hypothetical protein AsFPU3_0115 [Aphanothece sacrum FPU3]